MDRVRMYGVEVTKDKKKDKEDKVCISTSKAFMTKEEFEQWIGVVLGLFSPGGTDEAGRRAIRGRRAA